MLSSTEMKFPVLAFPFSGRSVVVAKNNELFEVATLSQIKAGFFEKPFRVIDSNSTEFLAAEIIEQGGVGAFGGWNIFLNRTLKINISFLPVGTTELNILKEIIVTAIADDPTGILEGGEMAPDELTEKVSTSSNFSEIVTVLGW